MEHQSLYNDSAEKTSGATYFSQDAKLTKSGIKPGMSAKEIGDVISNHLMSHVDKAVSLHIKKGEIMT